MRSRRSLVPTEPGGAERVPSRQLQQRRRLRSLADSRRRSYQYDDYQR